MIKFGDYYHKYEKIGKGSYSNVYRGYHNDIKNSIYAVKVIDIKKNRNNINRFYLEIDIMKRIKHENIIKFLDTIENKDYIYIIMEYCKYGDLRNFLKRKKINEYKAQIIMKQLISGLKYLYDNNIFHRDLKPQNILVSDNCVIKITDFGLAKECEDNNLSDTICGSPIYMAPEIIQHTKYNSKADIWSLGIIFYELLTGKTPYNIKNYDELVDYIKHNDIKIPKKLNISKDAKNLLSKLLIKSSKKRIKWKDIFVHPWICNKLSNSILFKSGISKSSIIDTSLTKTSFTKTNENNNMKLSNINKTSILEDTNETNETKESDEIDETEIEFNNGTNTFINSNSFDDSYDNNAIFSIELSNYKNEMKNNENNKFNKNKYEDSFFKCSYIKNTSSSDTYNGFDSSNNYDLIDDSLSQYNENLDYIKKQDLNNSKIVDNIYNILNTSKTYINSFIKK